MSSGNQEMRPARGGYRHGRKRAEVADLADFHCYTKVETHSFIREVARQNDLTHGEIIDKLVEKHIERQKRRHSLVQLKDSSLQD